MNALLSAPWFISGPCRAAAVAGLLLLAGCASTEYNYTTRTADGKRMSFTLNKGRIERAEAHGITMLVPQLLPDVGQKKLRYLIGFDVKGGGAMERVQVHDVSDEKPMLVVDETEPVVKQGRWASFSQWYSLEDAELHWLTYVDDSFRVFRITVQRAGQPPDVLYQPVTVPGFAKAGLRTLLGQKS